jgi:cytochrome c553
MLAILIGGAISAEAQAVPPPGATACSGCHGPGGSGSAVPLLRGRSSEEIVVAMQAFRTGGRPATVMDRIAKGFTDGEIRAIASWLSQQR